MTIILEQSSTPPTPARGRPPRAVKCVETGQVFGTCDLAAEWLASVGASLSPSAVRKAVSDGDTAGGFRWRWDGKTGPLKGSKYRPRGDPTIPAPPVACIPRTPVCCPDTGESYRDAEVAAEVLRSTGYPDATALRIVRAITDSVRVADRYWDWRARHMAECGTEAETGAKCPGCAERAAAFLVAEVVGA